VSVGELSVEDRLKKLEESHNELLQNIDDLKKKQESDMKQVLSEVRSVRRESAAWIYNLRSKVSKVFESGVELEVCGIGLFIIGAAYATIPASMLWIISY